MGLALNGGLLPSNESGETRTRTITQRDARRLDSESVSLMVDFYGTGEIAYEFDEFKRLFNK
jgi:hypothetical protein